MLNVDFEAMKREEIENIITEVIEGYSIDEAIDKLLNLHSVSKRNEVNLVVFEEYTRCYKVTDSELEKLMKDGDIEEGDTVCKAVVIKNY